MMMCPYLRESSFRSLTVCRYWNSVEDYCRRLAKRYSQVNIISGPLYLPQKDSESNKKFVKYEVSEFTLLCSLLYSLMSVVGDTSMGGEARESILVL